MLVEALLLAGWFRFVIRFFPFRMLTRHLGAPRAVTPAEQSVWRPDGFPPETDDHGKADDPDHGPVSRALTVRVAHSVRTASRRVPWESKCLVQACAGFVMLRRRGVGCRIYLGVRRDAVSDGQMRPHAWLTSRRDVLLGGGALQEYAVVSVFVSESGKGVIPDHTVSSC